MWRARTRGSITLEILIAFAIFSSVLASVILLLWGNNANALASEREELMLAKSALVDMRAISDSNFFSIVASTSVRTLNGAMYVQSISVDDLTPCLTSATVSITGGGEVGDTVTLATWFGSRYEMTALGNDCQASPPTSAWTALAKSASDSSGTVQATSVDALSGHAYIGTNTAPYLLITDSSGHFVSYANGFTLSTAANALDAVTVRTNGIDHRYVFAAIASTTNQLAVVDVTDMKNPVRLASRTLLNVDATGSFPQGWRLFYYDGYLYIATRETKGAELHIFDVGNPAFPIELGTGTAIDITLNDFVVRKDGVGKKYLYAATARDTGEIGVYDVTTPQLITELKGNRIDLAGNQDGQSVALIGNRLYVGRQSAPSGADLYVYDASTTAVGLPLLGSADIGTGVTSIKVVGNFAFLGTVKAGKQVQVWDVGDMNSMKLLSSYAVPTLTDRGLDFDSDSLFVVSANTPIFQMLTGQP